MTTNDKSQNNQNSKKPSVKPSSDAQFAREVRLAENLRANLRRRKAATRKAKTD